MGRPRRDTAEYFPHDANASNGDTLSILQGRYGNDGYAFWFKLLEKLTATDGHSLDLSNQKKWQLFVSKMGVSGDVSVEIMDLLVEMNAIDSQLWNDKVVWSQNLVNNLSEVYRNRRRKVPEKPVSTPDNPVSTPDNPVSTRKTGVSTQQSRVEYSRVENIIYVESSPEYRLASLLKAKILENNPRTRIAANLQKWCQQVHLLLSKNGYQPDEVERVIEYSQTDSFWKANILSAGKLREKFDTLHLQVKEQEKGGRRGKSQHSRELPKVYTPTRDYPDL